MVIQFFRGRVQRVHFIGIGGIGMSGIAEVLLNLDYEVTGSDLKASETTDRLTELGARIAIGHRAENVGATDVVVTSSAVRRDNPEVVAAHASQIPVIPRAEMLAELMRLKYGIAVAGTHGKTTTTSLVAAILAQAGIDPTIVIGGKVNALGTNARLGQGQYLVAEADESDGSFLRLTPTIAVVTNIDPEHLDYWSGGLPQIQGAFVEFVNKVPFYGLGILCLDHTHVQTILPSINRRYVTYGLSPQADYRAEQIELEGMSVRFVVHKRGAELGRVHLKMVGQHNVVNCLAAIAVGDELGASWEDIATGIASFEGVARRFQVKDEVDGITIIDDYGHHPAEVRAVLEAARALFASRRLVVAFQPHRYSRTQFLLQDFATSFNLAEKLFVTDIYAASEDPIAGISGEALAASVREHGHRDASHVPFAQLVEALATSVQGGDVVFTLGAGTITQVGPQLAARLRAGAGRKA
ncbi:MAG: UDP-N-acetylmuramate--L-alanine ligase [Deltaproteobacteria bacterium]|nr:UDP-N-acetylmuramate--L-alanine ligase [Deltaproteobacteria bacterium]